MAIVKSSSITFRRRSDSVQDATRCFSACSRAATSCAVAAARSAASCSWPAFSSSCISARTRATSCEGALGVGLARRAQGGGLLLRGGHDLRRVGVGVPPALGGLVGRLGEHLAGLVLGQPEHRAHPLAHALHALRRADQAAHLDPQPLGAGPRLVELPGELCGLVQGGIPVGGQDLDLRIQPAQMGVHLALVVAPADHLEAGTRWRKIRLLDHTSNRTGTSRTEQSISRSASGGSAVGRMGADLRCRGIG